MLTHATSIAEYAYYAILAALLLGIFQPLIYKRNPKVTNALLANIKYVFWAHGLMTFSFMYLLEPRNLVLLGLSPEATVVTKYALQSLLALTLWDMGHVWSMDIMTIVLIDMHHIGLFVALFFGFGASVSSAAAAAASDERLAAQAHMDSCMFGWFWSIHSFGFLLEVIFPLVGIKLAEGQRSVSLDAIKHVYAAGTVYVMYHYINGEHQPGMGFSHYQTWALTIMLTGRYLINGNWKNVDFLRRVELPGAFVVLADNLFFHDKYLERAIAMYLTLLLGRLAHKVFFLKSRPKPTSYVGPEENPELKKFLEDKAGEVLGKKSSDDSISDADAAAGGAEKKEDKNDGSAIRKYIIAIFDNESQVKGKDGLPLLQKDAWPLQYAAVLNDLKEAKRLIDEDPSRVNAPMSDWYECAPVHWALSMNNVEMVLLLLKSGANPYLRETAKGGDAIDAAFDPQSMRSFLEKITPGSLGASPHFFDEFEEIVLRKSPPAFVWSELSVSERAVRIIEKW